LLLALVLGTGVLRNQTWLYRLLGEFETAGVRPSGPLFRRSPLVEEPIRIAQLDELLHRWLEGLQADTPGLIGPQLEVAREYSFRRSIRRGSTTHARNQGTASDVIEANNRWRKLERAGHREAGLSVLDTYTDVQAALGLNLRYLESL
jgi:hypothetical protein